MIDTIVRGYAVIRGVATDDEVELVPDGAVLVRSATIVAVAPYEELHRLSPDAQVLGSATTLVAPGFVNAHHHVGLTPFQLGAPDLPLELWLAAKIGLPSVDPYLDTLYSAFEMIASGVTTVQHLHVARGPAAEIVGQSSAILRAYDDIGLRASYSYGFRDQNRLAYEDDDVFLASLPTDLAAGLRPWFERQHIPLAVHLDWIMALVRELDQRADGRLRAQLAPANLHWCSDAALAAIGAASRRAALPMHLHLLETRHQKLYAARRTETTAVRHLHALGLLGPLTTLGHMVWADESDLDLVAATGTCICHNASSNLRLRSGTAPCMHFLKRGIVTAIGIDEAGLNDDRDMLQEMRLVQTLHRPPGLDEAEVPSAAQVFRMATEHGARTTPFAGRIGRLDPGYAADLVLYDWNEIATPYLAESVPFVDALLRRAKPQAVRSVMVAGHVIYEDGRFLGVSRSEVMAEIRAALVARPRPSQEARLAALRCALLPHLRQRYAGELPALAPNSPTDVA
jgi:5-methylthioadenosine/S-adenosylhomocysteine deaminase